MKYFLQICLTLTIIIGCIQPGIVVAVEDEKKESYQTAELVHEIRVEKIDDRSDRLNKFLKSRNSPMADSASYFVEEADRLGIDWKLVPAIAGNESYFGSYIPENSYNGWGWAVWTGWSYGAAFKNWNDGITTVAEGLKENYLKQGLQTVEQIGTRYAADPQWAWKVNHFMEEIERYDPYTVKEKELALLL